MAVLIAAIVSSSNGRDGLSYQKVDPANVDTILSSAVVRQVDSDIVGNSMLCGKKNMVSARQSLLDCCIKHSIHR